MNKDVIYVEPEDDITDIILKIENSKEKIVALVPPKKAGVFRSVVNIKLIEKSGASSNKKVVLVTVDPSIVRLAAAAKIPVTKNLQTAPTIPEMDEEPENLKAETLVEESDGEVETEEDVEELIDGDEKEEEKEKPEEEEKEEAKKDAKGKKDDEEEDEDEKEEEKKLAKSDKKDKKPEKSGNKFVEWFKTHKKLAIIGGVCFVLLIGFMVWAFAIAPAATVSLAIETKKKDPSEVVSFTDKITEENADEGKFYIEEKKIEDIKEVEFEATGKKNVGEKAKGEVTVVATLPFNGGTKQVKTGDAFTNDGLTFVADRDLVMSFDGEDTSVCSNVNDNTTIKELKEQGCKIYAKLKVTAAEPGTKYNISARETGWDVTAPVSAYSTEPMSGGTDQELTIVQQSDVDKAKESLASTDESANKDRLLEGIGDDKVVISSSFKQETGDAIATPGVGEEVKDGTKPKLKAVTTATVYVVDKAKLEEFLTKKAELEESQEIYEMNDIFIENFAQSNGSFTGRLKANYQVGPKITTSSIVDLIKGKGFGDAQHTLKDYGGVTDVHIKGSFPWVNSIPNDTNKITVEITAKDDKGSTIDIDAKNEEKKNESEEKKDEKKEEKSN